MIKRILFVLLLSLLAACKQHEAALGLQGSTAQSAVVKSERDSSKISNNALIEAYNNKKSHLILDGVGTVKKILPDDTNGLRHQKFLVSISPEITLLFAHNIDLAERVEGLQVGDEISFHGEYIYNPKGGVVHWTHHDPKGTHEAGWITYKGHTYQ